MSMSTRLLRLGRSKCHYFGQVFLEPGERERTREREKERERERERARERERERESADTQLQAIRNFQQTYKLSIETLVPSKEVCMSPLNTKENLIAITSKFLLQRFPSARCQHKLILTSKSIYPVETSQGL